VEYKRLKDGTHVVGFRCDGKFLVYTSVFDAREGKALIRAIRAVFDLFHATSGAYVTMLPDGSEAPRSSSRKAAKKKALIKKG
jgi:hypothetical protein